MKSLSSYSPRILLGRRHFEALFQTVPLNLPSFQGICHKFDECPPIQAMGHCKNGWHVQCVRRGVCCTVKKKQKNYCCAGRRERLKPTQCVLGTGFVGGLEKPAFLSVGPGFICNMIPTKQH